MPWYRYQDGGPIGEPLRALPRGAERSTDGNWAQLDTHRLVDEQQTVERVAFIRLQDITTTPRR